MSSFEASAQNHRQAAAVRRAQASVLVAGVLQDAGAAEQHVRLVPLHHQLPAGRPAEMEGSQPKVRKMPYH